MDEQRRCFKSFVTSSRKKGRSAGREATMEDRKPTLLTSKMLQYDWASAPGGIGGGAFGVWARIRSGQHPISDPLPGATPPPCRGAIPYRECPLWPGSILQSLQPNSAQHPCGARV
ncbi:hypothetical protein CIHG_06265 [Coccidioides immitis H538.4]|uniref:Uncharacterized protein n=1 Tax=Coccidioides immitis H538.4 TaxID=396776 RepID=A0A0J8RTB9_COCIT|nr:hypothetical protein CIHG_06265 [Coccidioides immitis H538.4]